MKPLAGVWARVGCKENDILRCGVINVVRPGPNGISQMDRMHQRQEGSCGATTRRLPNGPMKGKEEGKVENGVLVK